MVGGNGAWNYRLPSCSHAENVVTPSAIVPQINKSGIFSNILRKFQKNFLYPLDFILPMVHNIEMCKSYSTLWRGI